MGNILISKASFIAAARNGDLQTLIAFVENGGDVNASSIPVGDSSSSPTDSLTKSYSPLDRNSFKHGCTALMQACIGNHEDCVEYLLQKGADLEVQDLSGQTALILACKHASGNCIQLIMQSIIEQQWSTERIVAYLNHMDRVDELTALMQACCVDSFQAANTLIRWSEQNPNLLDVNFQNNSGFSALLLATQGSCTGLVEKLFTASPPPRVNTSTADGFAPLLTACRHSRGSVIRLFLDQPDCPDLNMVCHGARSDCSTALHEAAQGNRMECVNMLLLHTNHQDLDHPGTIPDLFDSSGLTPIMLGILENRRSSVMTLLPHIDIDLQCAKNGKTALQMAIEQWELDAQVVVAIFHQYPDANQHLEDDQGISTYRLLHSRQFNSDPNVTHPLRPRLAQLRLLLNVNPDHDID